ncbi:MAG: L,D-transpeptidase family protein [Desulfobacterales bacterium]
MTGFVQKKYRCAKWCMAVFMLIGLSMNVHAVGTPETESGLIPDLFVPFDTNDAGVHVLVVEKETQQLLVYEYKDRPREIYRFKCSTGKKEGPKTREGDSKTPEGIYFFINQHDKSRLAPIYGAGAFPTDYPNLLDRMSGKTGSEIWLHGTNKALLERDSNGCVVLENGDFEKVSKLIVLHRTPIIITDRLAHAVFDPQNGIKTAFSAFLSGWIRALESGTYHDYLACYDPEYLPDIGWWPEWNRIRKEFRTEGKNFSVSPENMLVFRHKDIYTVLFDLSLGTEEKRSPVGAKQFFLSRKEGKMAVIGENWQIYADSPAKQTGNPVILASRNLIAPESKALAVGKTEKTVSEEMPAVQDIPVSDIEKVIDEWLTAWSSKNIETYGSFYTDDFISQGMSKKAWLRHKESLNRKYRYIRVTQKNMKIRPDREGAAVSFVQTYESDKFRSASLKTLLLKRENDQWKIWRESSAKL